jgi:hypothetical protein
VWLKIYAKLKTFNTKLQSKNDQTNRISNAEEYKSQTQDIITEFGPRPTSPLKPVTLEKSTIKHLQTRKQTPVQTLCTPISSQEIILLKTVVMNTLIPMSLDCVCMWFITKANGILSLFNFSSLYLNEMKNKTRKVYDSFEICKIRNPVVWEPVGYI